MSLVRSCMHARTHTHTHASASTHTCLLSNSWIWSLALTYSQFGTVERIRVYPASFLTRVVDTKSFHPSAPSQSPVPRYHLLMARCVCLPIYPPCSGSGADADIVVSSARAYISAINKLLGYRDEHVAAASAASQEKAVVA